MKRPLYSVFSATYEFMRLNKGRRVPWWPSARRELDLASRLVHLATTDLTCPVAPVLLVSDAEGSNRRDHGGGAVVARPLAPVEAEAFRNDHSWEVQPGSPPPASFVAAVDPQRRDWRTLERRRWRFAAHNNVLELEAALLAAKQVARCPICGTRSCHISRIAPLC